MKFDTKEAARTLAAFCGALDGAGYGGRYWLSCGTLLGYRRDGDFIAHDGDIDLGMLAADYDDRIPRALAAAGFTLTKQTGSPGRGLTQCYSDGRTKADIFYHYRDGDRLWHMVTPGPPEVRYYYTAFETTPVEFQGVEVAAPDPVDRVLAETYGPGWRAPVKRWHYAYSPSNVVIVGNPPQRLFFLLKNGIWQVKSRLRAALRGLRARPTHG